MTNRDQRFAAEVRGEAKHMESVIRKLVFCCEEILDGRPASVCEAEFLKTIETTREFGDWLLKQRIHLENLTRT